MVGKEDLGSADDIPSESNYKSNLESKGFTEGEIVAIASIPSFGVLQNPEKLKITKHPKFDNYYYKQVLSAPKSEQPLYSD